MVGNSSNLHVVSTIKNISRRTKISTEPLPKKNQNKRSPFVIVLIIALAIIGLQYSTSLFSPDPETESWGKIILPAAGSVIGNDVTIVGETQDIAAGHYIWIAVDKPDIGLCWPQKRVLRNTRFRTKLKVEGHKRPYFLSLYILNETLHIQWKNQQEREILGGLPMLTEMRRLDSVKLILGND